MSKYLSDTLLADIVPSSIAHDETIRATNASIQPCLMKSIANIARLMLFSRLFDTEEISANASPVFQHIAELGEYRALEESLLDLLAWQFHVDNYDVARTYQEKLEMVRLSIQIHRKKGTPWAIKRAVEAALQDTMLTLGEWFQQNYKGTKSPYHFNAELLVYGDEVLKDHILRAKRIIENTKSLRSHCDGITITIATQGNMAYGFALCMANTITIQPELVTEISLEPLCSTQGQALHTESILSVFPEQEEQTGKARILVVYPNN